MTAFDNFLYRWKQEWSRHKQCHFILTMSPFYKLLQCVLLNRLFQTFAECCSMFICFPVCCEILLAVSWQKIFYILVGFVKNLFSNSVWLILACKLKWNCVSCGVSQLWRHQAIKQVYYMRLWSIHPCFHRCKNYKNRPRNARVIVENKVVPYFMKHDVGLLEFP